MLRNVAKGPDGTTTVFEDPTTTLPLAEDFASSAFTGKDIFLSITYTSTRPGDPYRNGQEPRGPTAILALGPLTRRFTVPRLSLAVRG